MANTFNIGVVKDSVKSTVTNSIGNNGKIATTYSKVDNETASVGIDLGKVSLERSISGPSISIQSNKRILQYENEYMLIHKFSYIDYNTQGNITNSSYYTLTVNHWWTAGAILLYNVPHLIPSAIGVLQYAPQ